MSDPCYASRLAAKAKAKAKAKHDSLVLEYTLKRRTKRRTRLHPRLSWERIVVSAEAYIQSGSSVKAGSEQLVQVYRTFYCYLADDFELLMPIFASPRSSFDPLPVRALRVLSAIVGESASWCCLCDASASA